MSTKVYSGFRLTARTLRAALDDLERISKQATAILADREHSFLACTATNIIDESLLRPVSDAVPEDTSEETRDRARSPLSSAWRTLMERQDEVRKTRRRDPAVDFEVIFRLWLCRKTNAFIGYVIAEGDHEFLKLLTQSGKAMEYGYWNNCDGPDHLNERQWKKRGDIWHDLLNGKSGPWFDVRVPEPHTFGDASKVVTFVPSLDKRVGEHAFNRALNGWFREQKVNRPELDPMDAYFEFRSKRREGDAAVTTLLQKAKEEVTALLPAVITADMLRHGMNPPVKAA